MSREPLRTRAARLASRRVLAAESGAAWRSPVLQRTISASVRLLMAQAAAEHNTAPRMLSFRHTVQLWNEFSARSLSHTKADTLTLFFELSAQQRVGHRPCRIEPRARKRRPKSFQWLKVPRHAARRQIKRLGY